MTIAVTRVSIRMENAAVQAVMGRMTEAIAAMNAAECGCGCGGASCGTTGCGCGSGATCGCGCEGIGDGGGGSGSNGGGLSGGEP
jgi:hypothetical protein